MPGAAGCLDPDLVIKRFSHQGPCHRGVHADPAAGGIELVRADDTVDPFPAVVVLQGDPGAEEHQFRIGRWTGYHLQLRQTLLQVAHAPVDLAQFLLAVDIFRVLRTIAFGCGGGQGTGDTRAAFPQFLQFLLQVLMALAGDIGRGFLGGWPVTSHRAVSRAVQAVVDWRSVKPLFAWIPDVYHTSL
jgi:hypothetical protein